MKAQIIYEGETITGKAGKDLEGKFVFKSDEKYKTEDETWNKMRPFEGLDFITMSASLAYATRQMWNHVDGDEEIDTDPWYNAKDYLDEATDSYAHSLRKVKPNEEE
jgi:hypothetical protein